MNYLSLFSGIEAASVAWAPLGWKPVGFAEIEPFPCAVLAHHYPDVPNFGDVNNFKEWPDLAIDLVCGGSPCQSFSNAGLRAGLDDPRGQLMLTFGAVVARYRPKWVVWENVPGVLSSGGGCDFASLLGLLSGQHIEPPADGWQSAGIVAGIPDAYGLAWRVLDAQYVRVDGHARAVPQRRQRVFVVGCLGDWRSAAAVLLEREGLRGDPAPRRSSGQAAAAHTRCSSDGGIDREDRHTLITGADDVGALQANQGPNAHGFGDFLSNQAVNAGHLVAFGGNKTSGPRDVASALSAHGGACGRMDFETETFVAHTLRGEGFDASGDGKGRGTPIVIAQNGSDIQIGDGQTVGTITASQARQTSGDLIAFDTTQITNTTNHSNPKPGDPCHTLAAGAHPPAVAFKPGQSEAAGGPFFTEEYAPTLQAQNNGSTAVPAVAIRTANTGANGHGFSHDVAHTLDRAQGQAVAFNWQGGGTQTTLGYDPDAGVSGALHVGQTPAGAFKASHFTRGKDGAPSDVMPPLSTEADKGDQDPLLLSQCAVRRLLPVECERLQGFPDGYTRIPNWNGWRKLGADETPEQCMERGLEVRQNKKTGAWRVKDVDGPRYKALGNSWACNVARWVGMRIELVEQIHRERSC